MKVERFDAAADSASVRACYEIYRSGLPADDPLGPPVSARGFAGWLALGWTEDPLETWLARDDSGQPCGWYVLTLHQRENRDRAHPHVVVHAARRRAGRGTALLQHAAGRAARAGRTVLDLQTREGSSGVAFAGTFKARRSLASVRRVLALDRVPAGRAGLRAGAEAAARGYTLRSWSGPTPEDAIAGVARVNAALADAPRADGEEEQVWDEARVRLDERRVAAMGLRPRVIAACAQATGELAALTQLCLDPGAPEWGFQELTAVARPHRGHRLGLLLKLAMLDLVAREEPQLTRIITGNDEGNDHMIAINEQLGFEVLDRWLWWELDVADVPPDPPGHD